MQTIFQKSEIMSEDKREDQETIQDEQTQEQTESKDQKETSSEEVSIEEPVKKVVEENVDYKDKYIRLYSDFENFRKRNAKEKIDIIQRASGDLAKDILPVIDDFERAIKVNEESEDASAAKEGFKLIYDKFVKTLATKGIKEMEAVGEAFDVDKHEAITQIPAGDDMKGKVVDVVEKGYYMNDSVLRYAKVVVGQ